MATGFRQNGVDIENYIALEKKALLETRFSSLLKESNLRYQDIPLKFPYSSEANPINLYKYGNLTTIKKGRMPSPLMSHALAYETVELDSGYQPLTLTVSRNSTQVVLSITKNSTTTYKYLNLGFQAGLVVFEMASNGAYYAGGAMGHGYKAGSSGAYCLGYLDLDILGSATFSATSSSVSLTGWYGEYLELYHATPASYGDYYGSSPGFCDVYSIYGGNGIDVLIAMAGREPIYSAASTSCVINTSDNYYRSIRGVSSYTSDSNYTKGGQNPMVKNYDVTFGHAQNISYGQGDDCYGEPYGVGHSNGAIRIYY